MMPAVPPRLPLTLRRPPAQVLSYFIIGTGLLLTSLLLNALITAGQAVGAVTRRKSHALVRKVYSHKAQLARKVRSRARRTAVIVSGFGASLVLIVLVTEVVASQPIPTTHAPTQPC
jgi:hypothetical protein